MCGEHSRTDTSSGSAVIGEADPSALSDLGHREMVTELVARRDHIRTNMGGSKGLARLRADGHATVRERIDLLVDPNSFVEIGTFVVSERPEDRDTTAGDGKIGGHATIDNRPVTVVGDDATVKRGSTAYMGGRRKKRLLQQAARAGHPFIHLGESAGARIPDILDAKGATELESDVDSARRQRRFPLVSVITGNSYGGSSFMAAFSDLVIQVRGTSMSVTSPRLIETATGEKVTPEELGGLDVHMRITGQVDLAADDDAHAMALVRQFLSYLPSNSRTLPPRLPAPAVTKPDHTLADLVPSRPQRAYDMVRVLRRLTDDGELLELQPFFGPSLVTALARMGGHSVGIIASQPKRGAGAVDPNACDKATRFMCMCEAYDIPLVFLQDVPGFMVGTDVEHNRMLAKAIMFQQALALTTVPVITVILRKAHGLARRALAGSPEHADAVYAWPSARFGLMDNKSGAQIVRNIDLSTMSPDQRREALARAGEEFASSFEPYIPAERMRIDEVINPADTRNIIVHDLNRYAHRDPHRHKPLASWPTRW